MTRKMVVWCSVNQRLSRITMPRQPDHEKRGQVVIAIPALVSLPRVETSHLPDALMFAAVLSLFYGTMQVARTWFGPFTPRVEISHSLWALPGYAGYSLLRISVAYFLSLGFTLVYGYIAAYNPKAERFIVTLLDVLQSIPVLSFLPGVMLAMVALFPSWQLGLELGAVL